MEVHFTPETEKRLKDLAAQSGTGIVDEFVRDVIEEYFGDLTQTRETLDQRYDDLQGQDVDSCSCTISTRPAARRPCPCSRMGPCPEIAPPPAGYE